MGLCRVMLNWGMTGEAKYGETDKGDYDLGNLIEGRDMARYLLQEGYKTFPHDTQIDCRLFIKWATHKIKEVTNHVT